VQKSFGEWFLRQKESQENDLFYDKILEAAYLVGAFSAAVVHYSWVGVWKSAEGEESDEVPSGEKNWERVSKVVQNDTFKKWLSIRPITRSNLLQIRDKAEYFMRRLGLDHRYTRELADLSTRCFPLKSDSPVSDAEVSFAFSRGYYDFFRFLKGEEDEKYC